MIEIKSIVNLIQENSKVLAEIESLKAEQIFVDKIESFTLEANEYIEQLESENAELRKDKERLDFILNHYKFTLRHRDNEIPEIVMSVRNFNKSRNDFIKLIDESINYK